MVETSIKLKRSDPTVKKLLNATYPDYNGRKITAQQRDSVSLYNTNWSGGSKNYYCAVNLQSGRVSHVPAGTWYNPSDVEGSVNIPVGCAIVRHSYFCGKDSGITIYYNGTPDVLLLSNQS